MDKQKGFFTKLGELIDEHHPGRRHNQTEDIPQKSRKLLRLLRWLTPNGGTLLLVAMLIVTQQVWAGPLLGTTNTPGPSATTVNYQGRLSDDAGVPLNGTYGMSFALYDAPTSGNLVWGPESHAAVPVSDGLFGVGLGSQTSGGIPTSVWNGDVYLEVTVGGETLEPRELIRSVPIAGMALTVPDGSIDTANLADGAVTADKASGFVFTGGDDLLVQYQYRQTVTDLVTTVTFSQPFASDPAVVATADTTGGENVIVRGVSPTGFVVEVPKVSGNLAINWIAIGPAP